MLGGDLSCFGITRTFVFTSGPSNQCVRPLLSATHLVLQTPPWGPRSVHSLGRQRRCLDGQPWALVSAINEIWILATKKKALIGPHTVHAGWHVLFDVKTPREPQFEQLLCFLLRCFQLWCCVLPLSLPSPGGLKRLQMKYECVCMLVGVESSYTSHCPNPPIWYLPCFPHHTLEDYIHERNPLIYGPSFSQRHHPSSKMICGTLYSKVWSTWSLIVTF